MRRKRNSFTVKFFRFLKIAVFIRKPCLFCKGDGIIWEKYYQSVRSFFSLVFFFSINLELK